MLCPIVNASKNYILQRNFSTKDVELYRQRISLFHPSQTVVTLIQRNIVVSITITEAVSLSLVPGERAPN